MAYALLLILVICDCFLSVATPAAPRERRADEAQSIDISDITTPNGSDSLETLFYQQVSKKPRTTDAFTDLIVSGGPPVIHGNSGDNSHKSSHKTTTIIIAFVIVGVVVGLAILSLWLVRRKISNHRRCDSGIDEQSLSDQIEAVTPNLSQQKEMKFAAADRDATEPANITTTAGRMVVDRDGDFALFVHASRANKTITAASCHLKVGEFLDLPRGVIPRSRPIRLMPDHFEYEKPACLMIRVADNVCLPEDCQLSLWHSVNTDNPHYTELTDTICRPVSLPNGHRYVSFLIKHHCDVVLCQRVPDANWELIGEVYAELSQGVLCNLHVFIADKSETVQEALAVHCSELEMHQVFVSGGGTVDGKMVFRLVAGFDSLAVNMETFTEGIVPSSEIVVCECQAVWQNVQHIVFPAPPSCVLRVSAMTGGIYEPSSDTHLQTVDSLLCEVRLDLNRFRQSESRVFQQQEAILHTWQQPLAERRCAPVCVKAKTEQLRRKGTLLEMQSDLFIMRDFLFQVGLTVTNFHELANRLLPRSDFHFQLERMVDTAGSEVATCDQIGEFLSCYRSGVSHPCSEEVIGHVVQLQEDLYHRVEYLDIDTCDDIKRQFEELIAKVQTYYYEANLYERQNDSSFISAATTGPRPENDLSLSHTRPPPPPTNSALLPHAVETNPRLQLTGMLVPRGIPRQIFTCSPNIPIDGDRVVWVVSPATSVPHPGLLYPVLPTLTAGMAQSHEGSSSGLQEGNNVEQLPTDERGDSHDYRESYIGNNSGSIDTPPNFNSDGVQ